MTGARARTRSGDAGGAAGIGGLRQAGRHGRGCGAPAAEAAVASPEGAFLAYEHDVQVQLEAAKIAPRIQQIAQACQSAKFGDCAVLQVDQRSGEQPSGEVKVRIAPKGAEPLIAMAGEGGKLQSRNTRAEDLAQAVADTALTKARRKGARPPAVLPGPQGPEDRRSDGDHHAPVRDRGGCRAGQQGRRAARGASIPSW